MRKNRKKNGSREDANKTLNADATAISDADREPSQTSADYASPSATSFSPNGESEANELSAAAPGSSSVFQVPRTSNLAPAAVAGSTLPSRNRKVSGKARAVALASSDTTTSTTSDAIGSTALIMASHSCTSHRSEQETTTSRLQDKEGEEKLEDPDDDGAAKLLEQPGAFSVRQDGVRPRVNGRANVGMAPCSQLSAHGDMDTVAEEEATVTAPTTRVLPALSAEKVQAVSVGQVVEAEDSAHSIWKSSRWGMLVCGLILFGMVIAVPLVFLANKNGENHNVRTSTPALSATPPPTTVVTDAERVQSFTDIVVAELGAKRQLLETEGTPQFRAIHWLADMDPAQLDPTDTDITAEIQRRYVAAVLYFSLKLDETELLYMMTEHSICEWNDNFEKTLEDAEGILCLDPDSPGNPTSIALVRRTSLHGFLPAELGYFSSLRLLNITQSSLRGEIPKELADCSQLEILDLSYNYFTGEITAGIGDLIDLRVLDLQGNSDLRGTIPVQIGNLVNLELLDLSYNALTGGIPSEIFNLTNLSHFGLRRNRNQGSSLSSALGSLTKLQFLDLGDNGLVGTIPTAIGNLVNLEFLDLSENGLWGTIPDLQRLEQLTALHLFDNVLSGDLTQNVLPISNTSSLTEFDIRWNRLTGNLTNGICESNIITTACSDCILEILCSCCSGCCL